MKAIVELIVLAVIAPGIMAAGPRSSARYAICAEANDAGGAAASSAAYANAAHVGGFGGISTAAQQTAKHGYLGQLYEVAALTLAANPPSVNEGEATQLSATVALDDGSWIQPGPSQVQWSVISGPVDSISAAGLASMAAVYQNETAAVRGQFQGGAGALEIAVLNADLDNYGGYRNDGIDDAWQVQHFGFDNASAGPGNDPDGDGQNNSFEYYATTNPIDALSLFRLWIANVAGQPNHKRVTFSPRSPARDYQVEYKTALGAGAFAPLGGATITDNGLERTVTDENATDAHRFYRVNISIP